MKSKHSNLGLGPPQAEDNIYKCFLYGAFKLIKLTVKPSFKPFKVNATMNNFIIKYHLQTCFKPASNYMTTSVNRIL